MDKKKLKILFFSPHAAIWVHAFPEALIAETLKQRGHQIVYITCGKIFGDHCVCMSARSVLQDSPREDKERICSICINQKKMIKAEFQIEGYDLDDLVSPEEIAEIERMTGKIDRGNFLDFKIDQIEIGRVALYQFLLQHKKNNLTFSEKEWERYLIEVKNTLFSFFAGRKILEKEKPDRVISYNSLYSVNRVWHLLAQARNIPDYFLHASGSLSNRLETLLIGRNHSALFYEELLKKWKNFKNIPCSEEVCRLVIDHYMVLLRGQNIFAYSSPRENISRNIKKVLGIMSEKKVITATMSSYDERFSAETVGIFPRLNKEFIFKDQIEWLNEVIEYVRPRKDLFLIIRVHPREFPNRREKVQSTHVEMLKKALSELPENVRVNWPTDGISLYDLAEVTDLFLNAWSGAGKEMSLLGLPVVVYSPDLLAYPADLNYVAKSKEDYFSKIEVALKEGWSFERIRQVFRWYALEYKYCVNNISDSFRWTEGRSLTLLERVLEKVRGLIFPYYKQRLDCSHRNRQLKEHEAISHLIEEGHNTILDSKDAGKISSHSTDEETETIKRELKRLTDFMYPDHSGEREQSPLKGKLVELSR